MNNYNINMIKSIDNEEDYNDNNENEDINNNDIENNWDNIKMTIDNDEYDDYYKIMKIGYITQL